MRRQLLLILVVLSAVALAVLVVGAADGDAPWFVLFLGRFHPTVVHFPIALLLLAAAIEMLAPVRSWIARARPAVPFLLAVGALTALASVSLGYLLSLGGGYDPGLLSWHMWLGLAVTAAAIVLAVASARISSPGTVYRSALASLTVLVLVAGHLGGSLARGSGYLTYYLPVPVKQALGLHAGVPQHLITNLDSARVYADLVQPVLDRRCVKCHGPSKSKGDLRLDAAEGIERGGRDGEIFVSGNPAQSEIVRRITLPPYHEDVMPPSGEPPLDVGETELIRWWIANGASFETRFAEIDQLPSAVETYLNRVAAPRAPQRSGIFALDVPEADTSVLSELRRAGFLITRIDPEAPFLRVSALNLREDPIDTLLSRLMPLADQIAELDMAHTRLTDRGVLQIASMPHLIGLYLQETRITDAGLEPLTGLAYLEYLNLYGTMITGAGLSRIAAMPSLEAVYLWRTGVSEQDADSLRRAVPELEVVLGGTLAAASIDSTEGGL